MTSQTAKISAAVERFDKLINHTIGSGAFPGAAVAWIVDGQTVHAAGYGLASPERNIPVTTETMFRAASISKLFNAIAAMQLVEQGKLDLDSPIENVLPSFSIVNPFESSDPITVRNMLCHRAGLVREAPIGGYFDSGYSSNLQCLESVSDCVLVNPPNTKTCYSNVGPTVIGTTIERLTGMSFEDYQRTYILGPLGMDDSAWSLSDEVRKRLAQGIMRYNRGDGTFSFCDAPVFDLGTTPAGSLVTTVTDLAKFASFVMSEPSKKSDVASSHQLTPPLITPKTLNEMLTVQLTDAAEGFGLGFINRIYRGHKVARHSGQLYGFTSLFSVMQEKKLGVIILANGDEIIGPVRKLTDAAFDLLLEAVHGELFPAPIPSLILNQHELAKFSGEYESQSYWITLEVANDGGGHRLIGNLASQPIELTPVEPLKFLIEGRIMDREPVRFKCDSVGNVTGFSIMEQQFERLDKSKIKEPPAAWQKFVGSYGPEYIPLVVSIRNGHLYACAENEHEYRLRPLNRVTFLLPPGMYTDEQLVFQIDETGKPYAILLAGMYLKRNSSK